MVMAVFIMLVMMSTPMTISKMLMMDKLMDAASVRAILMCVNDGDGGGCAACCC